MKNRIETALKTFRSGHLDAVRPLLGSDPAPARLEIGISVIYSWPGPRPSFLNQERQTATET